MVLREPLRCEVLTQGDTTEFCMLEQLVDTTSKVEDTVHYDMGTQMIDVLGSTQVASRGPHPNGHRQ